MAYRSKGQSDLDWDIEETLGRRREEGGSRGRGGTVEQGILNCASVPAFFEKFLEAIIDKVQDTQTTSRRFRGTLHAKSRETLLLRNGPTRGDST